MNHDELQGYLYIPCKTINAGHNPVCNALKARTLTQAVRSGISTLLINFDEDSGAGRRFTRDERAAVAAARRWFKRQPKDKRTQ